MNTCTSSILVESGALAALFMICEHHQAYRMGRSSGFSGRDQFEKLSPQGLKPASILGTSAARLKSCPFTSGSN